MADVAVDPATFDSRFLERRGSVVELGRTVGPPGRVPQARAGARGDLQAVMEEFAPRPQVDGVAVASALLQPEDVFEELTLSSGLALNSSTWCSCEISL